jgi:hypothetical protein
MYWGTSETLLPVYQAVDKACEKHPEVDTVRFPREAETLVHIV